MVRKGIRTASTSVSNGDIDTLHRVYAESVRNLGSPVFPRRYFRVLADAFPDEHDVTTVLHEGRPVASVLNFHFREEVLPYYGGGTAAARGLAANDFMYWEVMRRAGAERGARAVRFRPQQGRAPAPSPSRRTGASSRTPLHYCYRLAPGRDHPRQQPEQPEIPAVHRGLEAAAPAGRQPPGPAARARAGLRP